MSDEWDSVSNQIADLVEVTEENGRRFLFAQAVRQLIAEMDARARAIRAGADYADDIRKARTELLKARDALQPLGTLVDTSAIGTLVEWLSILIGENSDPAAAKRRGRRKGSVKLWPFHLLVHELLHIGSSTGADFTLSDLGGEPKGSLAAALELLRPHVACIPKPLTYDALEEIRSTRASAGKSSTALAILKRLFPPPLVRH